MVEVSLKPDCKNWGSDVPVLMAADKPCPQLQPSLVHSPWLRTSSIHTFSTFYHQSLSAHERVFLRFFCCSTEQNFVQNTKQQNRFLINCTLPSYYLAFSVNAIIMLYRFCLLREQFLFMNLKLLRRFNNNYASLNFDAPSQDLQLAIMNYFFIGLQHFFYLNIQKPQPENSFSKCR